MTLFTVSDSAGLYDALANATGGDTIELASGDYGELGLWPGSGFDVTFDSAVTITSADPEAQASFSEMRLNGVENLILDNVVFDYTYDSADELWYAPFEVLNSSNITIRNSLFDGDVATSASEDLDGFGFAKGLFVRGSSEVSVEDNEFTTFHRGMVVMESQDIAITGNDIHSMRSDGMNFSEVQSVLIEGNYVHDFKKSPAAGDHMDMIQFWTNGTDAPNTDITIRGNILDIGEGQWTQSIFMRNEEVDTGKAGSEMFYQNVLIEENTILNGHSHGITVGETNGLTIRNNSVLSIDTSDDNFNSTPTIRIAPDSTSVNIQQNAVSVVNGYDGQVDWSLNNNAYIQNTHINAPGYYGDLFLESSMDDVDGARGYVVAPGSMIELLTAGSPLLFLDTTPDVVTPIFDVTSSVEIVETLVFDASYTYGPEGQVLPEDAVFFWDFGDGTTATGRIVEHSYDTAGGYNVTLQVLLDGQDPETATSTTAEVAISGDDILAFNASDGEFYLQGYGAEMALDNPDEAGVDLDLGGTGTIVEIGKEALSRFFGTDAFEMSMTLQADQPGVSWGEVARIHSSITVSIEEDGDLRVELFPDTGERVNLSSQGIAINDGATHDISIVFDGASNSLQIVIDGTVAGSQTVAGSMPEMGSWGLAFGNPWGKQNFDGKLSAFELDASSVDYPPFEGELEEGSYDEGSLQTLDDFVTAFETLRAGQLRNDANVETDSEGSFVQLDGEDDFVRIGKLEEFSDSDQISFSVSWSKDSLSDGNQRLVWNNKNIGATVEGDSLKIYVGQEGKLFREAIIIDNLGLDDTDLHQVTVMVDAESDHLQVVLDGVVVLDQQQESDITFSEGIDNGWKLGGGHKGFLDGEIYDFRIEASAEFLPEDYVAPDDVALIG